MTDHIVDANKNVPPCPVCGNVPADHSDCVIGNDDCMYCAGVHNDWDRHINHIWFMCINELGIETVEQLRAKVQPDPRVAVLAVLYNAASEWRGDHMSDHHLAGVFDTVREKLISAQRGEE